MPELGRVELLQASDSVKTIPASLPSRSVSSTPIGTHHGHGTSSNGGTRIMHIRSVPTTPVGTHSAPPRNGTHSVAPVNGTGTGRYSATRRTPARSTPTTPIGTPNGRRITPTQQKSPVFSSCVKHAKMSKHAVRVVAQPPRIAPTVHVQPMAGRPYNEMVDYAERQRQQIEANRIEEERRMRSQRAMGDVKERLKQTRKDLAEEELELGRLTELERETRVLRARNGESQNSLSQLQTQQESHQQQLRQAAAKVEGLRQQLDDLRRRRQNAHTAAAAEHKRLKHVQQARQHQQQQIEQQKLLQQQMEQQRAAIEAQSRRPRASVEPFNVQAPKTVPTEEIKKSIVTERQTAQFTATPLVVAPPADDACSESSQSTVPSPPAPSKVPVQKDREDISPSPPKDPHPTPAEPTSSIIKEECDSQAASSTSSTPVVERPAVLAGESVDEPLRLRQGRTDLVSLRPHSLQATKRRSWAASESSTMSELDAIKRVMLEAQKRGVSHYCPQVPVQEEQEIPQQQKLEPVREIDQAMESATDDEGSMESGAETKSDEEQPVEMEIVPEKKVVKGILRPAGMKKEKRRIEFDPLALLLDAALEGEMDLVRKCADKLPDVSAANDEGITALHNAICAGHYEIVKFLIDKHADVNAQDSDGWTPLHCAASCNNLPMVRLLVEGGACLLAATLSDLETPIEKCEEDEEGYDGCLNYLLAAHNATGTVNNGRVYAAYSYDAQFEDELTFEGGEELKVVSKDDEEKGWWRCERIRDAATTVAESGLCPRTYLALYPPIKYRQKLGFVTFQIPMEANNNADGK